VGGQTSSPTLVAGLGPVSKVIAGGDSTCALQTDGKLFCWGVNTRRALSTDEVFDQQPAGMKYLVSPLLFSNDTDWVDADSTGGYTCGLRSSGKVYCRGANDFGQLGRGVTSADSGSLVEVSGLDGVVALSAYSLSTCALRQDGALRCWGRGAEGQMGDGLLDNAATPVAPGLPSGVVKAFSQGNTGGCAVQGDTTLCWGNNGAGQLGQGTIGGVGLMPAPVTGLAPVAQVSVNGAHVCAVGNDGKLRCWGLNQVGQLGDGTTTTQPSPVEVLPCGAGK
jgi:alpha-tubulin suppressor-like RCC1 family protein